MRGSLAAALTSLLLIGATAALAQDDSHLYTQKGSTDFYAGAGFAKQTNDGAPDGSIGAQGGLNWMLSSGLGVGAMAGYYVLGSQTVAGVKTSYQLIPVTGQLSYTLSKGSSFRPYLDGGAGLYFNRVSQDPGTSDSNSRFGWNAGAGFEVMSGSMGYGIDAKYHILPKKDLEPESGKVLSAMGTLHFH